MKKHSKFRNWLGTVAGYLAIIGMYVGMAGVIILLCFAFGSGNSTPTATESIKIIDEHTFVYNGRTITLDEPLYTPTATPKSYLPSFTPMPTYDKEYMEFIYEQFGTPRPTLAPTPMPSAVYHATNPSVNPSITVYITESGSKYHRSGCQYLYHSKIAVSLENAIRGGYTPCSKCNPPTLSSSSSSSFNWDVFFPILIAAILVLIVIRYIIKYKRRKSM